jgi:hypothetical protein
MHAIPYSEAQKLLHRFLRAMYVHVREFFHYISTRLCLITREIRDEEMMEAPIEMLPSFLYRHRGSSLCFVFSATARPFLDSVRPANILPRNPRPIRCA